MAASIYATPPPDLSSEDTALSDVSNSSTLNTNRGSSSNNNNNTDNNSHMLPHEATATTTTSKTTTTTTTTTTATTVKTASSSPPPTTTTTTTTPTGMPNSPSEHIEMMKMETEEMTTTTAATAPPNATGSITNDIDADTDGNANGEREDEGDEDGDGDGDRNGDDGGDERDFGSNETGQAAMAAMAAAANAAMQLQLFEALNDAAKKRRKQHNPSRLEALNLCGESENDGQSALVTSNVVDYEDKLSKMFLPKSIVQLKETFELLQQQQQQQQQDQNISEAKQLASRSEEEEEEDEEEEDLMRNPYQTFCKQCGENFETDFKLSLHMLQEHAGQNGDSPNNCDDREDMDVTPMDFLASVQVKLEHSESPPTHPGEVKESSSQNHLERDRQRERERELLQQQQQQANLYYSEQGARAMVNGKEPHWLNAMPPPHPGMPPTFPFSHEAAAAAALGAGAGYLPLLGMPGFPTVDGLNRPPLRIFNPEAYCELCNKEFCNKYFLKTHKANKHGIFDPVGDTTAPNAVGVVTNNNNNNTTSSNNNNPNHLSNHSSGSSAMFPIQQLQREIAKPPAPLAVTPVEQLTSPAPPPPPPMIQCDICSKRFNNPFAMRRHRVKVHEQNSPPVTQESSRETGGTTPEAVTNNTTTTTPTTTTTITTNHVKQESASMESAVIEPVPFQMPEGFREDFTLEQEELAFTPPPKKLGPQQQQQARDANFAPDKLRRLGVQRPEAFCELCCKEYCNKYFLRTHKWKRHGIFVPPDDPIKDEQQQQQQQQQQLAQKMAWPFMGIPGMPLNLMLANEKARLLAAAAAATATSPDQSDGGTEGQMAKRIKLESVDTNVDTNDATNYDPGAVGQEKTLPEDGNAAAATAGLQNLQKLQSMLQQLNDFKGQRPLPCHLCGRELEHQYALQAHLMTEHAGMSLDNPMALYQQQQQQQQQHHHHLQQQQHQQQQLQHQQSPPKNSPNGSSPPTSTNDSLRCQQCERDFVTAQEFKQHIAEVHLMAGSPLREGFYTPERPSNSGAGQPAVAAAAAQRPPYTITPTSSYCEICNKELCNKYFMKTHMQRMHGIEIENGAQIGGVVCNICNKELCSKYFLRVHKHNTHGIIEDGAPLPQPRGQNGLKFEQQQQQQQQQLQEQELSRGHNISPQGSSNGGINSGSSEPPSSAYNEQCPLCTRHFRSTKWLRTHLMNDHGAAGVERLRELEQSQQPIPQQQQQPPALSSGRSKPSSPTLKIPNGSQLPSPANLAQALQNLNAQHLLGQMPKAVLPGMFGAAVAEQAALQSPRFKEYQCSLCPFTTPYYAFLFIHERSHALLNSGGADPLNSQAAVAEVEPEAELPKTDRALALIQGKVRVKPPQPPTPTQSSRAADVNQPLEPTNLTTTTTPTTATTINNNITTTVAAVTTSKARTPTPITTNTTTNTKNITTATPTATATPSPKGSSPKNRSSASITPTPPPPTVSHNGATARSAATSPIDLCLELANGSGKPASYAIPDKSDEAYQMQAFHFTPTTTDGERIFAPAVVYLPVRARMTEPATITFKLAPA